jgi:hypothetical protein
MSYTAPPIIRQEFPELFEGHPCRDPLPRSCCFRRALGTIQQVPPEDGAAKKRARRLGAAPRSSPQPVRR